MPKSEKLKGRSSGPTTTSAARAEPGNESSSSPGGEAGSREARISEAAFFKAAARAFAPGHEWEDWFAAEQEIDAQSPGVVRKRRGYRHRRSRASAGSEFPDLEFLRDLASGRSTLP